MYFSLFFWLKNIYIRELLDHDPWSGSKSAPDGKDAIDTKVEKEHHGKKRVLATVRSDGH
jgi:hypothetical protein